jgi:hypothetical protein
LFLDSCKITFKKLGGQICGGIYFWVVEIIRKRSYIYRLSLNLIVYLINKYNKHMRKVVSDKISYFYNDRIVFIEKIYEELFDNDFLLNLLGIGETTDKKNIEDDGFIHLDKTFGYNFNLIIPEIFEELNCSIELIRLGFFKQSNQILRNSLELIIELLFINFIIKDANYNSQWLNRTRGIEHFFDMTEFIRHQIPSKYKNKIKEIEKFYNLLNRFTHSHKDHLNSINIGKFKKGEAYGFEYSIFHNSFIIHICCLEILLTFLFYTLHEFNDNDLKKLITKSFNSVHEKLSIFKNEITDYKKGNYESGEGYLIYRKNMNVNGKQILYSYLANHKIIWPSKNKGLNRDWKIIYDNIDKELIKKKFID